MVTPVEIECSDQDLETLQHLSNLLHLFHHRSKNQHRHSIWWRHFSIFRQQLKKLITEITALKETPTTHLARTKKKFQDVETKRRIDQRLAFWRDVTVCKWQRSFSQIVADGRFSVLGLVLLAVLAEVCRIVGITAELEELGQAEVEKVLEIFAAEAWSDEDAVAERHEDVGQVVRRDEATDDATKAVLQEPVADNTKKRALTECSEQLVKKKKTRRKKANAIDDLFSGLG